MENMIFCLFFCRPCVDCFIPLNSLLVSIKVLIIQFEAVENIIEWMEIESDGKGTERECNCRIYECNKKIEWEEKI